MKAFLGMYGISLGLIQEQIVDVQVSQNVLKIKELFIIEGILKCRN